jgi:hypothetical protein
MHDNALAPPSAAVRLQLEGPIFELIEDWRRSQPEIPSRSEAVRLLLALALSARPNQCVRGSDAYAAAPHRRGRSRKPAIERAEAAR